MITAETIFDEDPDFASVLQNRAKAKGEKSTITDIVGLNPGQFATSIGIALLIDYSQSAPGSSKCLDLLDAEGATNQVVSYGSVLPQEYRYWKAAPQPGRTMHRRKPGDIYVAHTVFGTSN